MNARPNRTVPSLNRMLEATKVPPRAVGMFWLGGPSIAFKSPSQLVYVIDPVFPESGNAGPVGAIDVRPDMVLCTLRPPEGLDVTTLSNLATAYPDAQFVSSDEGRDVMIGRSGHLGLDDVPVNPARVHAQANGTWLDVRTYGLRDSLKIRSLPVNPIGPWCMFYNFGSVNACVFRGLTNAEAVEEASASIGRRVDVLIWDLARTDLSVVLQGVASVRPRYVIPIGYDQHARGGEQARRLREEVADIPGVKVYLFPDDYLEGLVYSRIMSRQRRNPKSGV
jgi:hypothetical protein